MVESIQQDMEDHSVEYTTVTMVDQHQDLTMLLDTIDLSVGFITGHIL